MLSKTSQKKLSRHARLDMEIGAYSMSAFLIAQFGKNEGAKGNDHISGNQLMDLAISVLQNVQRQVGGGVVFLECEDKGTYSYCVSFKEMKGVSMCEAVERYADQRALDKQLEMIRNLMDSMKLTAEQAMTALKLNDREKAALLKKL